MLKGRQISSLNVKMLAAVILFSCSVPAWPKTPPAPTEPANHPDWAVVSKHAVSNLTSSLFDPSSAQIEWSSGFHWGFMKAVFGKRTFGWIACGRINAKNRMGGYVGAQPMFVFVTPEGDLSAPIAGLWITSCDASPNVPVQNELIAATPGASQNIASELSVADELTKLAELRAKGIITEEEFQMQKAKLLQR